MKVSLLSIYPDVQSFGLRTIGEIKRYCMEKNESKILLDSIYDVRGFYRKCGFGEIGTVFERVGLPHIRMELEL